MGTTRRGRETWRACGASHLEVSVEHTPLGETPKGIIRLPLFGGLDGLFRDLDWFLRADGLAPNLPIQPTNERESQETHVWGFISYLYWEHGFRRYWGARLSGGKDLVAGVHDHVLAIG